MTDDVSPLKLVLTWSEGAVSTDDSLASSYDIIKIKHIVTARL